MEEGLVRRLEAAVTRLETLSSSSVHRPGLGVGVPNAAAGEVADPAIFAFDAIVDGPLGRLLAVAERIGGEVLEATRIVGEAFVVQRELLIEVKRTTKPDLAGFQEFLSPLNEAISRANALTERRKVDFFNHLKAAADSLSALAWIAYTGKDCGMSLPIGHVEESWQMAEFYNNKILVEYKNKDADHLEWAKTLKELYVTNLRDFVKSFYPLGPTWSASSTVTKPQSPSASLKALPVSMPAPPPGPAGTLFSSEVASSHPKVGMAAVFQSINSGESVTAGLRKVTDDMKTKNRTDRTGVVGVVERASYTSSSTSFPKSKPPKLELQMGRKWAIENQIGNKNVVIDDCDPKQSVYIFGCKDAVVQVNGNYKLPIFLFEVLLIDSSSFRWEHIVVIVNHYLERRTDGFVHHNQCAGKVNNITIDNCNKTGILFTDVVAACEIVNSNCVQIQCQGSAPSISVDNTAGCQLYLSQSSLDTSITTAKSSEINVMIPAADADSDWGEHALPQQFLHVYKDEQFTTIPVSHSGA